jgi:AcrR family transcriptional regulator
MAPTADPAVATRLVEVAARILDQEGRGAINVRRVTRDAGVSTMAIYTHFGGIDELFAAIWREGYLRFGAALVEPAVTADAVADWMTQGWAYRRFALEEPHLYKVMFGPELTAVHDERPDDGDVASQAFVALLDRLDRCVAAGRFAIDDVFTAGEVAWSTVHGAMEIELSGYHAARGRDPVRGFGECLRRLAIGFGDEPDQARRALARAWRRAKHFTATG